MENPKDNYVLKLSGKAELPEPIEISHNFRVLCEGSIVAETISDNEDNSRTHYFTFKPVNVEAITGLGKRIKAKDTRSRSTQMRALFYKRWREDVDSKETQEEYYDRRMVEKMLEI